ncbi:mucin-5AC-like [Ochlerotatus camptorhynchus]|uniref:mucin-5AC-like n=1 Tax=Ochlerotatus camptorhynchus TaxID=644619 RepID=UPI0031D29736
MGVFLSVLVASVGVMDLITCLGYVSNQLTEPPAAADQDLERYRQLLKDQIETTPKSPVQGLTIAKDGVPYKDGYRVEKFDESKLDQLNVRIQDLERVSQEKDQTLDRLNVKLQELERKSVEREHVIDELRSKSVSRSASPEPTTSRMSSSSARDVPQIVLDDDDPRRGSSKFRPIHRDDEFRRTIKKRSISSNVSEDRTDELEILSQMEADEANTMEDYIPLVYNREEYLEPKMKKHMISPIQELCQMHEDDSRARMMLERSPEPSLGADVTRPWGDIKLEETKEKTLIHPPKDLAIQEESRDSDSSILEDTEFLVKSIEEMPLWQQSPRNTYPELPQIKTEHFLTSSESFPSNLSSHSNSPDLEHPTLKRTRKKSDLTALLLEEERKSEAFSGVVLQTEESDSEGGNQIEFMQSKSPSPFVGPFLENDHLQTTGQLIPLVQEPSKSPTPDQDQHSSSQEQRQSSIGSQISALSRDATISPAPIASSKSSGNQIEFKQSKSPSPFVGPFLENEHLQTTGQLIPLVHEPSKSPTPDQDQHSSSQEQRQSSTGSQPSALSRDATISPAPIASSGSPASPVSSIVDEYVKDGPCHTHGSDRSSPVQSERNVSRDGSVSLASTDASTASLDLHVDQAPPAPPISPPLQHHAAASVDLNAGGVDRKSSASPSPDAEKPAPPRRFRIRKRAVRSVTPINFDQTFMDSFSECRVSVSPSELEDYINSMDVIKIEPPKPVAPNYFIPTTPMTSGVPSLLVTDEKGAEARFHDSISSKSFYGNNHQDPGRVVNHRVSYVEWIKKFPENMTSHLELEDYDSDDEEVENIINGSKAVKGNKAESPEPKTDLAKLPVDVSVCITPSPEPLRDLSLSPAVPPEEILENRTEFPLNLEPSNATPSPASQISDISLTSASSAPDTSSMAMGSPLLNSVPSPSTHFTPITSPIPSLTSPTPNTHSLSPHPSLRLHIPSRSPTVSPIPPNMTPEEVIFDIGHLDGLIFETRSRSPTPLLQTPSAQVTPLSPEELAYDIGNLGGLILGPPSRSVSPLPPSSSPTPGSSLSSAWTSLQAPSLSDADFSSSDSASDPRRTTTHGDTNKNSL